MADAKTDEIRNFVVGPIQTNCYAYVSGGACMVVDPGAAGAAVAEHLADVRVECVAPFCINAADAERAMHAGEPSELGIAYDDDAPAPDRELSEGDVISVGTATFTVMETPGHTPGGIVLLGGGSAEGVAFVGDTLFPGSHGRTDLDGGDEAAIMASLRRMAKEIAPATTLLCGHGPSTTMAAELARNPFLR